MVRNIDLIYKATCIKDCVMLLNMFQYKCVNLETYEKNKSYTYHINKLMELLKESNKLNSDIWEAFNGKVQ